MNPHFANLETSLSARAATIEAIHREAAAARATARSRAFGHAFKMIGAGIGAVVFEPGFALQAANDGVLPTGRAA